MVGFVLLPAFLYALGVREKNITLIRVASVFGVLDILPFTGVTFPFVSKGGSSMLSCWMLLAYIKAADTRRGASFVVRLPSRNKKEAQA